MQLQFDELHTLEITNVIMNFPKDNTFGADPEEIINCRCTIKYF